MGWETKREGGGSMTGVDERKNEVSGANCEVMGAKARGRRGDIADSDGGLIYVARSVVLLACRKLTGINAVREMCCQASSTVKSVRLCTLCLVIRQRIQQICMGIASSM
jgi:hypothetical protein